MLLAADHGQTFRADRVQHAASVTVSTAIITLVWLNITVRETYGFFLPADDRTKS